MTIDQETRWAYCTTFLSPRVSSPGNHDFRQVCEEHIGGMGSTSKGHKYRPFVPTHCTDKKNLQKVHHYDTKQYVLFFVGPVVAVIQKSDK